MNFIYSVAYYIGYFWVLIIALLLSIILAKRLYAWIPYAIGAIMTYLSISGNEKSFEFLGITGLYDDEWTIYFYLLVISAIIIILRYANAKKATQNNNVTSADDNDTQTAEYKCDNCDKICEKTTYAEIRDEMGVRYRRLCDDCLEKLNATICNEK